MPSRAGKFCAVYVAGTPTAMTAEATTQTIANKEYQITSTARRVMSPTAVITPKVGGVAVNGVTDPYTIDRLRGKINFTNTSVRAAITFDGTYLPMAILAKAKVFSFTISRPVLYDTGFEDAGWQTHIAGQIFDVTGSLGRWHQVDTLLRDNITNDTIYVLAFMIPDLVTPDLLVWAKIRSLATAGAVDSLITEDAEYESTTDAEKRAASITQS